jgi:hypothetical protein
MRPGKEAAIAFLICGFVFAVYAVSPVSQSGDSFWTVPVMLSLLSEGNTNLDEYQELLRQKRYQGVECVTPGYQVTPTDPRLGCPAGSHYYYWYPAGTPFVALPLMVAMDWSLRVLGPAVERTAGARLGPVRRAFAGRDYLASHLLVEDALSSAFVALAAMFVFLTARVYLGLAGSIALALLFAFATSAWSTASRALWQHGPAMLMLSAALYLLSMAAKQPALLAWSAAPLVLAYFIRPTESVVLVMVGAYVLIHHRAQFVKWLVAAIVTAAPFLIYNLVTYHRLLQTYFTLPLFFKPTPSNFPAILTAFAGVAISPSRGLFVFSPFLVFSLAGAGLALRKRWMTPLSGYLASALALHWLALSDFQLWTAGHSYGPRLFSDVLPIFMFFMIPAFLWLRLGEPRRPLSIVFYLSVLISVFIHFRGARYWPPNEWNGKPSEVSIERVWDWHDPQFLRGLYPGK